jgi:hypothetical protein
LPGYRAAPSFPQMCLIVGVLHNHELARTCMGTMSACSQVADSGSLPHSWVRITAGIALGTDHDGVASCLTALLLAFEAQPHMWAMGRPSDHALLASLTKPQRWVLALRVSIVRPTQSRSQARSLALGTDAHLLRRSTSCLTNITAPRHRSSKHPDPWALRKSCEQRLAPSGNLACSQALLPTSSHSRRVGTCGIPAPLGRDCLR